MLSQVRHSSFFALCVRLIGGAAVVIVSFFLTLLILDRVVSTVDLNTDRMGEDFRSIVAPTTTPEICSNECKKDSACNAWSLVRAGVQRDVPVCYLKKTVPGPKADTCCTSGIVTRSFRTFF